MYHRNVLPIPNEESMRLAAMDSEFRTYYLSGDHWVEPHSKRAPASIAEYGAEYLDTIRDELDAVEVVACATSCSMGPITIICDGTSK
jgi:glutamate racemase